MKNFIKSLELRLSDLLLLLGLAVLAFFLYFGQEFMQHPNPNDVPFPLWAAIICFVAMIGLFGSYLYIELYIRKEKFNPYIAISFAALALLNIVAILAQPASSSEVVTIRYNADFPELVGTQETVLLSVSPMHKFIFIAELTGAATFIYIAFFVFSKRITGIKFIEYLGFLFFIFLGVMFLFSYITEYNCYLMTLKWLLRIDKDITMDELSGMYAVKSFILHKNAFGMMCMIGIIFTFINQSIKPRIWLYPLAVFFFINMVFSYCKTGILITLLVSFIYFIYRLIVTYKDHPKRNKITLIVTGSIILIALVVVGVPYLTKGKVLGKIYELIKSVTGEGMTMTTRTYIWDNCWQLLRNGWWLIGRGFGSICLQLMPLNIVTHNDHVFPTHSSLLNMIGSGGILLLLGYLVFLGYSGYVVIKSYKKSPEFVFAVGIGVLCFLLYSIIETIHYLMLVFLFPIFVIYFQKEKEVVEEVPTEIKEELA